MILIYDQDMVIGALFDLGIGGDGVGAGIAFASVIELHSYPWLAARHKIVGDSDGTAIPCSGAKIGV